MAGNTQPTGSSNKNGLHNFSSKRMAGRVFPAGFFVMTVGAGDVHGITQKGLRTAILRVGFGADKEQP
jgi:hypothetical protein